MVKTTCSYCGEWSYIGDRCKCWEDKPWNKGLETVVKAMKKARNAFVWNVNTDLDNIPACDKWAKMLRDNIDTLDQAIMDSENELKEKNA